MRSQRWAWTHRYAVPLLVTSVAALTISIAGLAAVVALTRGDGGGGNDPGIDECVTGSWRVVSHTEALPQVLPGIAADSLDLVGEGPLVTYEADGTGVADYGSGTRFASVTEDGQTVAAEVSGTVSFRYEAADGTLRYTEQESDARFTVLAVPIPEEYRFSAEPIDYQCGEGTLRFSHQQRGYEAKLNPVS